MSREDPQMKIRLPAGLKDRIDADSKEHGRSMNAEIIFILQSYYQRLDEDVSALSETLEKVEKANMSFGMNDPVERAAIFKSLLFEELMLLRRRVMKLGGPTAVLDAPKPDLVNRIEGGKIIGTSAEQRSLLDQILPNYPLSALLTDDELARLAERVIAFQNAKK